MKKWLGLLAAALAFVVLAACSSAPGPSLVPGTEGGAASMAADAQPATGTDIALIATDGAYGSAFGQSVWNTLTRFAGEQGLTAVYFGTQGEDSAVASTLELAAKSGAGLVLGIEPQVNTAVRPLLARYAAVNFMLVGADGQGLPGNAMALDFSAEEAGWLVGYVLGHEFLGSYGYLATDTPLAQRYTLGYVLGVEAAVAEKEALLAGERGELAPEGHYLMGMTLPAGDTAEQWAEAYRPLYISSTGQMLAPAFTFVADAALQEVFLQEAPQLYAMTAGVQVRPWPQHYACVSVEVDPAALLYKQLGQWQSQGLKGGRTVMGGIVDGSVYVQVEPYSMETAIERTPKDAIEYFKANGVSVQLALTVKPGDDGAWPRPEELDLAWLQPVPLSGSETAGASLPAAPASSQPDEPAD